MGQNFLSFAHHKLNQDEVTLTIYDLSCCYDLKDESAVAAFPPKTPFSSPESELKSSVPQSKSLLPFLSLSLPFFLSSHSNFFPLACHFIFPFSLPAGNRQHSKQSVGVCGRVSSAEFEDLPQTWRITSCFFNKNTRGLTHRTY